MKYIPKFLLAALVEAALDQPHPTAELQETLRHVLEAGGHKEAPQ